MSEQHPVESANIDRQTVYGFGDEWAAFDQTGLKGAEYDKLFDGYFGIFPFADLPPGAEGFDLGCGSGRWAVRIAERVGRLHCIDASQKALAVARQRLGDRENVDFCLATAESMPLADKSQDFGYSLGVLHHVPETASAVKECVKRLKPGAPFLLYIYYRFDNKPSWFRLVGSATGAPRFLISRLPFRIRRAATDLIAALVYWPVARLAALVERLGFDVSAIPLSPYRYRSFYSMRTDSLDRFGTRLEQRFTRSEIRQMMESAGLHDIVFSDQEPFWVACGRRR